MQLTGHDGTRIPHIVTKKKQKKIIKNFKELSGVTRRQLYKYNSKRGKSYLRPLDRKYAVSIARQLADGFEKINLHKNPTKKQYQKARKIIDDYFETAAHGRRKIVRPRKQYRKEYAEFSDMDASYKVFPMPVLTERDKFTIVKERGQKKVKREGQFVNTEFFGFPDRKMMAKAPVEETHKVLKRINRKYGKRRRALRFKVGAYETNALYDQSFVTEELEKWKMIYGARKIKNFVMGFNVYTFKGQTELPPSKLELKKPKGVKKKKSHKGKR